MADTDAITGKLPEPAGTPYYNEEWNFSIRYPSDWKILWQDEPAGSWMIPIAVTGPEGPEGRPCFMVNARRGELLQSSANLTVFSVGTDGAPLQMPATPAEFIQMNKATLAGEFPGFKLLSEAEIHLADKPAARLIYSYTGKKGRITEESVTLFGVGMTFQFICEVPSSLHAAYQDCFRQILESFRLGRPSPVQALEPVAGAELSPLERYNLGVSLYRSGEFRRALEAFAACFSTAEYRLQAAYAQALCQEELGRPTELPPELGEEAEAAGPVYAASNLACTLISRGYPAALTKTGRTSEVQAEVDGVRYRISIVAGFGFGGFFTNAWRKASGQYIPLTDRSANPNPSAADNLVISLVKSAGTLPPAPLPLGGLPQELPALAQPVIGEPQPDGEVTGLGEIASPPGDAPAILAAEEQPASSSPAVRDGEAAPLPPAAEPRADQPVPQESQGAAPEIGIDQTVEGPPPSPPVGPIAAAAALPIAPPAGTPPRIDFVDAPGPVSQQGKVLTFHRGRLSASTVSLSLDALRWVYLFMPQQFKWQIIQSKIQFNYEDLEALSEQEFKSLQAALAQQPRLLQGDFHFVLADYSGHVVRVSWKTLIKCGIDLMAELRQDHAMRLGKRQQWLRGNPAFMLSSALIGGSTSINAAGVLTGRSHFVPWTALEKLDLVKQENFNTLTVTFRPTKESKLKPAAASVSGRHAESCLAEIHFWRSLSVGGVVEGAAALAGAPPDPGAQPTGLATASLIFGILTWTILPLISAPVAIVTGHLALRKTRAHPDTAGGRGRAIAGLVLGYIQATILCLAVLITAIGGMQARMAGEFGAIVTALSTPAPAALPVSTQAVEVVITATAQPVSTSLAAQEQAAATERAASLLATGTAEMAQNLTAAAGQAQAAQSTGTAQVQQTQNAQQALQEAQVTASALAEAMIAEASQWPLVLSDDFSSDLDRWQVGIEESPYGTAERTIEAGKYRWKISTVEGARSIIEPNGLGSQSNFSLSFDARLVSGPMRSGYGVEFRSDQTDNLYLFGIFDVEGFAFAKKQADGWQPLVNWQASPLIHPHDLNRIGVIALGSHFLLSINDQVVAEVDDSSIASGTIGLSMQITQSGGQAVIEFDNFELRAPGGGEAAPATTSEPTLAATGQSTGTWLRLVDLPRQVNGFAVDPSNPQNVFAGAGKDGSGAGVFKSTDGGLTWASASDGLPSEDVRALAINPLNPSQLYAAVGMLGLVYASQDGGEHWASMGDPRLPGGNKYQLLVSPDGNCVFLLSAGVGLARNCGGEDAWQALDRGLPGDENWNYVLSLSADPADPNVLYAGTGGFSGQGHGVFKSSDGGETWAAANRGMLDYRITALAVDPLDPQVIYAAGDEGEFFKSTDAGGSWIDLTLGLPVEQNVRDSILGVALSPALPGRVTLLYDEVGPLVSRDGGGSWIRIDLPETIGLNRLTALTVLPALQPVILIGIEGSGGWRQPVN